MTRNERIAEVVDVIHRSRSSRTMLDCSEKLNLVKVAPLRLCCFGIYFFYWHTSRDSSAADNHSVLTIAAHSDLHGNHVYCIRV